VPPAGTVALRARRHVMRAVPGSSRHMGANRALNVPVGNILTLLRHLSATLAKGERTRGRLEARLVRTVLLAPTVVPMQFLVATVSAVTCQQRPKKRAQPAAAGTSPTQTSPTASFVLAENIRRRQRARRARTARPARVVRVRHQRAAHPVCRELTVNPLRASAQRAPVADFP